MSIFGDKGTGERWHPAKTDNGATAVMQLTTIYHVNGESYDVHSLDARAACDNHPDEYSTTPWSAEQRQAHERKRAEERQAADAAARERRADKANGRVLFSHPA